MQIFGALSFFASPSFRGGILHFLPPPPPPNCNGPMGNIRVHKTVGGSILPPPPSSFSSVDEGKKCLQPLLLFFSQKAATFSKGPNQGRRERKDRNRYIRATAAARKTDRGSPSPPSPPIKSFKKHLFFLHTTTHDPAILQTHKTWGRGGEKKKTTTGTDRPTPLPLLHALKMQLGQTDGPFPLSSFSTPSPPSCSSHRLLRYAGRQ